MSNKRHNPLPGFRLTIGYTVFYLSILVLIPLAGLFLKAFELSWHDFWKLVTEPAAMAAYRLSFGASLVAGILNSVFGAVLAWTLVRYEFWGKRIVDALIDVPFALPTAVAGLTLANLFAANGWLGRFLTPLGIVAVYTPLGVVIALTFVGLPFVVRTLQPVLENLEPELEEAAATLGAGRLRTFISILLPCIFPTLLTGFAMAFARAVGEYGSIVFVATNIPFETQIAPQLIVKELDQFKYAEATAFAVVLLLASFAILGCVNLLGNWAGRFQK